MGGGKVTASAKIQNSDCNPEMLLNGELTETVEVKDGDKISVSIRTESSCTCCEVKKDCNVRNTALWVLKNNKEKGTMVLNKAQLTGRLKEMAERMAKRKMGLRNRPGGS